MSLLWRTKEHHHIEGLDLVGVGQGRMAVGEPGDGVHHVPHPKGRERKGNGDAGPFDGRESLPPFLREDHEGVLEIDDAAAVHHSIPPLVWARGRILVSRLRSELEELVRRDAAPISCNLPGVVRTGTSLAVAVAV